VDSETLAHEVQFLHRIGVQGMTWPRNASAQSVLTFDERLGGAETILRANKALDARARPPVVIGV
jgi:hypothetical protein